jgi:hypothetical protein
MMKGKKPKRLKKANKSAKYLSYSASTN